MYIYIYIYTYISRARGRAEPGDRIARVGAYVSAGQGPQPPIYARSRARAGLPRLSTRIDFYARIRAYIYIYIYIYTRQSSARARLLTQRRHNCKTCRTRKRESTPRAPDLRGLGGRARPMGCTSTRPRAAASAATARAFPRAGNFAGRTAIGARALPPGRISEMLWAPFLPREAQLTRKAAALRAYVIGSHIHKADSTLGYSQAVPHPSTNRALRRLTSEFGRDPVHSTRYGR